MGRIIIADGLDKNAKLPLEFGLYWSQKLNEKPFILHGDKLADYETLDSVFAHLNLEVHQNYVQNIIQANKDSIARQLEQIDTPFKNIEFDSRSGMPAEVLIDEASKKDVDLIVLGHDMEKRLSRLFLGGVTESVVHKSPKSVLIAKNKKAMNPKKILVAFDFSYHCEESLEWAKKIAKAFSSHISLINVVPVYYQGYNLAHTLHNGLNNALEEVIENKISEVQSRLAFRVKELKEDGFKASFEVIIDKEGSISDRILSHIQDEDIDLLIMGSHGRGKIAELFLGSVSSKMIKKSPVSVLIAK